MKGFKGVNAFIDGKFINVDIAIKDDVIVEIGNGLDIDDPFLSNGKVLPGFIDEHIHGAGGFDVMDGDMPSLETIAATLPKEGTAAFLATTMTHSVEHIKNALTNVRNYVKENRDGATVLGVHLEGPFINIDKKGAQPGEYIAALDIARLKEYIDCSGDLIKLITVAPEVDGALDFIKYAKDNGLTVSAGHTSATYKQLKDGIKAGITSITHTYNAMTGIHHREVGVAGGSMLEDVYNEIIIDGKHASFDAIKLLATLKADKLVLITDAMRAKGMPDGDYELGGQPVKVLDGEARLLDGTLAGSVLKMNDAVKNAVTKVGLPFELVIKAVTENPAKNIGVFDKYGSIEVGKKANFTILDDDYGVVATIVDGKLVYSKVC